MESNNSNNGLITKIWGPHMWVSLHSICAGYPINPTDRDKQNYKMFFEQMGNVLPCKYCRDSYLKFIMEEPTILNDVSLKDRQSIMKWGYDIHNKVNNKLGVTYNVSFDDVVKKYETYRAKCTSTVSGCIMPLHSKKKCYIESDKKECPIIEYNDIYYKYAQYINFDEKNFYFWNIDKQDEVKWLNRNRYCYVIIKWMREHGIPSLKNGLPTKLELKLLLCLSTNLSKDELAQMNINIQNELYKQK